MSQEKQLFYRIYDTRFPDRHPFIASCIGVEESFASNMQQLLDSLKEASGYDLPIEHARMELLPPEEAKTLIRSLTAGEYGVSMCPVCYHQAKTDSKDGADVPLFSEAIDHARRGNPIQLETCKRHADELRQRKYQDCYFVTLKDDHVPASPLDYLDAIESIVVRDKALMMLVLKDKTELLHKEAVSCTKTVAARAEAAYVKVKALVDRMYAECAAESSGEPTKEDFIAMLAATNAVIRSEQKGIPNDPANKPTYH